MESGATRVRRIFHEACELAPDERASFLDRACADDAKLRRAVERLLSSLDGAGDFLLPKLEGNRAGLLGFEAPGARIGPYRLVKELGEGGFGVVFLAEQEAPVVRSVAIKVIKLGMDTRQVIARFEAERQALALMDHPNIARVFDAGATESGRPYFVMEYVSGEPITEYCDRRRLGTRERLALFVDVCDAIQHAHQKGVIHRDVKPANVLVADAGERPSPKVIDFGIAKATSARLTEKTLFTGQHQLVGTLPYMSPEQADVGGNDVDTRSDIYSLGVLLYELLTGTTPLDSDRLRSVAFAEVQRILREDEPPNPSARLETLGADAEAIAARRRCAVSKLARLVRGDLDWIVMKALEKERERRYESAGSLARDVERHLVDEPVSAGPPSRIYKVKKFVRRNRGVVLASALVLLTLLVGIVGMTGGVVWALRERTSANLARDDAAEKGRIAVVNASRAELEATNAKAVLAVLKEILQPAQTQDEQGNALPFVERLRRSSSALSESLRDRPEIEAQVRSILGSTFTTFEAYPAAEQEYARALELDRALHGELDPAVGRTVVALAKMVAQGGDPKRAARIVSDALERCDAGGRTDSPTTADLLHTLATMQFWSGDAASAESRSREALAMRERLGGHVDAKVAESYGQLGRIALRDRRWVEAKACFGESLALHRALGGELASETCARAYELAGAMHASGDLAGAIAILRESLESARRAMSTSAPSDPERLRFALHSTRLVRFLFCEAGHWEEIQRVSLEALEIRRELRAVDPLGYSDSLAQLGGLYWAEGDLDRAETLLREALSVRRTRDDEAYRRRAAGAVNMLAVIARDKGDLAAAEPLAREAHEATLWYNREPSWTVWLSGFELAMVLRLRGDDAGAQRIERQFAPMIEQAPAYRDIATAMRLERVGEALVASAQYEPAELLLAECERVLGETSTGHWSRDAARCSLALCLAARARFTEGEALLSPAIEGLRSNPSAPRSRVRRALQQAVELQSAWDAAEPDTGHADEADAWRARLAEHDALDAASTRR